jgi:hypothetical protein
MLAKFKHLFILNTFCHLSSYAGKSLSQSSHPLLIFFTYILMVGYFPTARKPAKVIPIPKPGKPPFNPGSYRPISCFV